MAQTTETTTGTATEPAPTGTAKDTAPSAGTADATGLHVGWIIPPFFHELPLDTDDADEVGERLYALVKEVLAHGTEDEKLRMFILYAQVIGELRDAGAVYGGVCFLDMDGRPSTASVAVYQMPLEGVTHDEALAQAEAALTAAHPDDDVRVSELPYGGGRGVVRIGAAPVTLPAELSPTGEPVEVPRGLIQVFVPLPNDVDMLAFELSTPSMEDWDLYSEIFAEIVRSLDWATEEEAQLAAALSGAPPAQDIAPGEGVVRELYARSSRVLEALGVRGRMDGDANRVSATTCPGCWSKGLSSVCSARHQWQIEDAPDAALASAVGRLTARFQADGWQTVAQTENRNVTLVADGGTGHRVNVAVVPGQRRIVAEVIAPCTRGVLSPGESGSAFG
jgi:hypothetical protein